MASSYPVSCHLSTPPLPNCCLPFQYLMRWFFFSFHLSVLPPWCATCDTPSHWITPPLQVFLDPETGVMLHPQSYLGARALLYFYSTFMCTTVLLTTPTGLTLAVATILILSSYVLICLPYQTFLFCLAFSHTYSPPPPDSPQLPLHRYVHVWVSSHPFDSFSSAVDASSPWVPSGTFLDCWCVSLLLYTVTRFWCTCI